MYNRHYSNNKDIMYAYLPMVKQAQERVIQ